MNKADKKKVEQYRIQSETKTVRDKWYAVHIKELLDIIYGLDKENEDVTDEAMQAIRETVTAVRAEKEKLQAQLKALKDAGEPFRVFYKHTLSKLSDISWVVRGARIKTSAFRTLDKALEKVDKPEKKVKDG